MQHKMWVKRLPDKSMEHYIYGCSKLLNITLCTWGPLPISNLKRHQDLLGFKNHSTQSFSSSSSSSSEQQCYEKSVLSILMKSCATRPHLTSPTCPNILAGSTGSPWSSSLSPSPSSSSPCSSASSTILNDQEQKIPHQTSKSALQRTVLSVRKLALLKV